MGAAEPIRMEWSDCWLEPVPVPKALRHEVKRSTGGVVPLWTSMLAPVPWVVRSLARSVGKHFAYMPIPLTDLIPFVVSQDNSCRYCYGATRTILKVLGYTDESIDRLERDVHLVGISPAEQAALRFARRISQANPRPGAADLDALERAGFTREQATEISYLAAFSGYPNRVATFFALPPDEPLEHILERPVMRWMRPLLARRLRGKLLPPMSPPVGNTGLGADIVAFLGRSPAAHVVRETIDAALASPVLPRRTKILLFAVVGRSLGCERTEEEARQELEPLGVDGSELDGILTNLHSAGLDRRERLLVPFARETVRYRSVAIQQRMREVATNLSREEVIEAGAVTGLANAVVRMAMLLDRC